MNYGEHLWIPISRFLGMRLYREFWQVLVLVLLARML